MPLDPLLNRVYQQTVGPSPINMRKVAFNRKMMANASTRDPCLIT